MAQCNVKHKQSQIDSNSLEPSISKSTEGLERLENNVAEKNNNTVQNRIKDGDEHIKNEGQEEQEQQEEHNQKHVHTDHILKRSNKKRHHVHRKLDVVYSEGNLNSSGQRSNMNNIRHGERDRLNSYHLALTKDNSSETQSAINHNRRVSSVMYDPSTLLTELSKLSLKSNPSSPISSPTSSDILLTNRTNKSIEKIKDASDDNPMKSSHLNPSTLFNTPIINKSTGSSQVLLSKDYSSNISNDSNSFLNSPASFDRNEEKRPDNIQRGHDSAVSIAKQQTKAINRVGLKMESQNQKMKRFLSMSDTDDSLISSYENIGWVEYLLHSSSRLSGLSLLMTVCNKSFSSTLTQTHTVKILTYQTAIHLRVKKHCLVKRSLFDFIENVLFCVHFFVVLIKIIKFSSK